MKDLVEAFKIFLKYSDNEYPINCQHDIMRVYLDIDYVDMTIIDVEKLEELGFDYDEDFGCFYSHKYGSN